MGRAVLACRSDEERKMATCPVFTPYPLHTDRQAESVRHCVGFRSGITAPTPTFWDHWYGFNLSSLIQTVNGWGRKIYEGSPRSTRPKNKNPKNLETKYGLWYLITVFPPRSSSSFFSGYSFKFNSFCSTWCGPTYVNLPQVFCLECSGVTHPCQKSAFKW